MSLKYKIGYLSFSSAFRTMLSLLKTGIQEAFLGRFLATVPFQHYSEIIASDQRVEGSYKMHNLYLSLKEIVEKNLTADEFISWEEVTRSYKRYKLRLKTNTSNR